MINNYVHFSKRKLVLQVLSILAICIGLLSFNTSQPKLSRVTFECTIQVLLKLAVAITVAQQVSKAGPSNGSITIRKTCDTTITTGWTYVGTVWSSVPAWITTRLGSTPPNIWAPDINYFNGQYYLYYGASIWGSNQATMGLATATNIEGPWKDQGEVTNVNYPIDPNVVWGPNNIPYITWGSWTGNGINMHVLDAATGKLSTTDNNLWHIGNGLENSTITSNNGYYLFARF